MGHFCCLSIERAVFKNLFFHTRHSVSFYNLELVVAIQMEKCEKCTLKVFSIYSIMTNLLAFEVFDCIHCLLQVVINFSPLGSVCLYVMLSESACNKPSAQASMS